MAVTISEFTPNAIDAGSATGTISVNKNCSANSTVVAFHWNGEWASPPTPSGTVGGASATLQDSQVRASGYPYSRCYYKEGISAGSPVTVTVNGFQSGRSCQLAAYELTGVPASAALDASASQSVSSTSAQHYAAPSGGINIAAGSMAIIAFFSQSNPGTITNLNGWTLLTSPGVVDGQYVTLAYKEFPSGATGERGNITATNDTWADSFIIAFKEAAGGGGSATIAADQGSYTLTGQDAGLRATRVLTADFGSYSLTGQTTVLQKDTPGVFTLTAEYGTYNWNGSDALADYAINAEFGVYNISGQDVTFGIGYPTAYSLIADYGNYTITGKRANLLGPGDLPTLGDGDKYVKLALMGYTGALNNMLLAYYQDNGATSDNLNEAEMQFLALQGATAFPLNNRRRQFYTSLGYEGALPDMEYQYWWNL